jgi:xylulokinase
MADVVIGCDVGTGSCKALALDTTGRVVARAAERYPVAHPRPGWAEQDARDWEAALLRVIASLVAQVGRDRVAAIGIAGQVDGIVPVDAHDRPLGPAPIWMDRRATNEAAALSVRLGAAAMRARTGLNIDASHGGPKIAWFRSQERAGRVPAADGYLLPTSFAVAALTGIRAVDPAAASSTMLMDVGTLDWADDLAAAVGTSRDALAPIVPAASVVGELLSTVAEQLGLGPGVRVVAGTGDEHAACLAAGVHDPGVVCDITGTAEPVAAASTTPLIPDDASLETHPHALPDRWLLENPGFVSGGSTHWLAEAVLGVPEAQLFALATDAPVGSDGLVFIPALGGAMTPRWNDRARGTFHGLRLGHDRRHLARAVLEGCAFALRDIVDALETLGVAGDRLRVVGGGARVTGRAVERLVEPEATALGAALLAATGVGWFPDAASGARSTLALQPHVDLPDAHHHGIYTAAYARYRRIFDALEPIDMGTP